MDRMLSRVQRLFWDGEFGQDIEILLTRYRYIFYYAVLIYPLFVVLDWHEIPWDRAAALVIRVSVALIMLALAAFARTKQGRRYSLPIITFGFLLGQAGFTLLLWHARALGQSDGDDFTYFFGPFCVLIPAPFGWTAIVGVVMILLEFANFWVIGSRPDYLAIIWDTVPFFVVFLSARHAANQLELAWKSEYVKRAELESTLTELRKTQDHLVQAEKMAALGRLTAGVAHELNNPLFVMGTNLSVLEEMFDQNVIEGNDVIQAENVKDAIQRLNSALVRASFVTQILREFSAPPKRREDPIDITDVVRLSTSLVAMTSKSKEVTIHSTLAELPAIHGDSQSLLQVLVNVLENACDAAPPGGNVWITTSRGPQNMIEIQVTDDGGGIPPDALQKLTEPFFTTKDPGKGMGLGLAVANNVIERHNGTLQFSNGELGAIVTIMLPLPGHTLR